MIDKIKALLIQYKEIILYLIFGVLTTVVNWVIYFPLTNLLGVNHHLANVIAWIAAVAFAFFTNRKIVFESGKTEKKEIALEAAKFVAGRLFSLGLEEVILLVGIDLLGINQNIVKIVGQIVVIVANYVISKLVVFKKERTEAEQPKKA